MPGGKASISSHGTSAINSAQQVKYLVKSLDEFTEEKQLVETSTQTQTSQRPVKRTNVKSFCDIRGIPLIPLSSIKRDVYVTHQQRLALQVIEGREVEHRQDLEEICMEEYSNGFQFLSNALQRMHDERVFSHQEFSDVEADTRERLELVEREMRTPISHARCAAEYNFEYLEQIIKRGMILEDDMYRERKFTARSELQERNQIWKLMVTAVESVKLLETEQIKHMNIQASSFARAATNFHACVFDLGNSLRNLKSDGDVRHALLGANKSSLTIADGDDPDDEAALFEYEELQLHSVSITPYTGTKKHKIQRTIDIQDSLAAKPARYSKRRMHQAAGATNSSTTSTTATSHSPSAAQNVAPSSHPVGRSSRSGSMFGIGLRKQWWYSRTEMEVLLAEIKECIPISAEMEQATVDHGNAAATPPRALHIVRDDDTAPSSPIVRENDSVQAAASNISSPPKDTECIRSRLKFIQSALREHNDLLDAANTLSHGSHEAPTATAATSIGSDDGTEAPGASQDRVPSEGSGISPQQESLRPDDFTRTKMVGMMLEATSLLLQLEAGDVAVQFAARALQYLREEANENSYCVRASFFPQAVGAVFNLSLCAAMTPPPQIPPTYATIAARGGVVKSSVLTPLDILRLAENTSIHFFGPDHHLTKKVQSGVPGVLQTHTVPSHVKRAKRLPPKREQKKQQGQQSTSTQQDDDHVEENGTSTQDAGSDPVPTSIEEEPTQTEAAQQPEPAETEDTTQKESTEEEQPQPAQSESPETNTHQDQPAEEETTEEAVVQNTTPPPEPALSTQNQNESEPEQEEETTTSQPPEPQPQSVEQAESGDSAPQNEPSPTDEETPVISSDPAPEPEPEPATETQPETSTNES